MKSALFAFALLVAGTGCLSERTGRCFAESDCADGTRCNLTTNWCEAPGLDAAAGAGGALVDAAGGTGGAGGMSMDATVDAPVGGGCSGPSDCTVPGLPFCDSTTNKCVQCLAASACSGATPICSPARACVPCSSASECAAIGTAAPVCATSGANSGACVECVGNSDCEGKSGTPACDTTTNKCVACVTDSQCSGATPVCATASHTCRACGSNTECSGRTATPACAGSGACVECTATADCAGKTATPVCDTAANKCVACLTDAQCSGATPICATTTHTCRACAADTECSAKTGTTACALSGTNVGRCVQCVDNDKCSGTTPICGISTNTCRGCTADSECADIGPGVCMSHQDKRCASDAETKIVDGGSLPAASTLTGKRLMVVRGSVTGGIAWSLSGLGQMSIVGLGSGATITGSAGSNALTVTGGDLYVRNVTFSGATMASGLSVGGGATLTLDLVTTKENYTGLQCSSGTTVSASAASGFLATGNSVDITTTTCAGVTSCGSASATCGAQ